MWLIIYAKIEEATKKIIESMTSGSDSVKEAFQSWQVPWTKERAEKLDQIDALAKEATVTSAKESLHGENEALMALVGKRADKIDGVLDTRSSQESVNNIIAFLDANIEKRAQGKMVKFTSPGAHTFTVPENVDAIYVEAVGGGGGSGSSGKRDNDEDDGYMVIGGCPGGGGAAGSYFSAKIPVSQDEKINIVVGAGGVGGTDKPKYSNVPTPGLSGGSTVVGKFTAPGGAGGESGRDGWRYDSSHSNSDPFPTAKGGGATALPYGPFNSQVNKQILHRGARGGDSQSIIGSGYEDGSNYLRGSRVTGAGGKNPYTSSADGGHGGTAPDPQVSGRLAGTNGSNGYVVIRY